LGWGCGLDSTVSVQGPVAGCCECGDEPSGSCATELVSSVGPNRWSGLALFIGSNRTGAFYPMMEADSSLRSVVFK
jgi:hypothetical protein